MMNSEGICIVRRLEDQRPFVTVSYEQDPNPALEPVESEVKVSCNKATKLNKPQGVMLGNVIDSSQGTGFFSGNGAGIASTKTAESKTDPSQKNEGKLQATSGLFGSGNVGGFGSGFASNKLQNDTTAKVANPSSKLPSTNVFGGEINGKSIFNLATDKADGQSHKKSPAKFQDNVFF